jgi:hypothetical protein
VKIPIESQEQIPGAWWNDFFESELWAQVHTKTKTRELRTAKKMALTLFTNGNSSRMKNKRTYLGMPMNWEWDSKKAFQAMWNADDDRLFPPKTFGIGWTINFHALLRQAGVVKKGKN